eukprot:221_1
MFSRCIMATLLQIGVLSQAVLDFSAFEYMLQNSVFHNHLIGPTIPPEPITAFRYTSNMLYFATQNGMLSMENIHTQAITTYTMDPQLTDGSIVEIVPIQDTNSVALLILEEPDRYAVSIIHVWPEFVTRVFIKQFDYPVCISQSITDPHGLSIITPNSMISVGYLGDEATHPFNDSTLPSQPMSCTTINNDAFTGYMVHVDHACFVAYLIDVHFNIETIGLQIIATHQNMASMSDRSTPILIPTAFGFITTSCIFDIDFHNTTLHQTHAMSFHLSDVLSSMNISIESVHVSDMQQTGDQLTFLFVMDSPAAGEKELHLIYGNIPYGYPCIENMQKQMNISAGTRRLLMAKDKGRQIKPKSRALPGPRRCDSHSSLRPDIVCLINDTQYLIQKRLGSGSHGDVFKALMNVDIPAKVRAVAIKRFHDKQEFVTENSMLITLKGIQGVVQRIDSSVPTGRSLAYLLVMDYISTGDVERFMRRPPIQFTTNQVINIVKQFLLNVSVPLWYINDKVLWIYADLKPENVLVEFNESKANFFLADMSCSLSIEEFTSSEGPVAGTPLWLSPEMAGAAYLGVRRFPSSMCIDAYGLELVAMHLYGALCNIGVLCEEAKLFTGILQQIYRDQRNLLLGFNKAFRDRSEAVSRALRSLENNVHDMWSRRQVALLKVLTMHLVRIPNDQNRIAWIHSRPNQCVSWREWVSAVQLI